MILSNSDDPLHCDCYNPTDNDPPPVIEIKTYRYLEVGEIAFSSNEILLIVEGKLLFTRLHETPELFFKGRMVFLPAGDTLYYRALTKCRLLVLRLEDDFPLCHRFSFTRLWTVKATMTERPDSLVPLELNVHLRSFVQCLVHTLDEGVRCKVYFRNGINVLLTMLHTYYTPEQLCQFFYPILNSDTLFSEQVRIHHPTARTVNELADALQMSPKQLNRRFNSVFGQAPYEWMQQEKARMIYAEISGSNKPFKEIAQSYGFTVQANFNRFCHTAFAMNPKDIRKKSKIAINI